MSADLSWLIGESLTQVDKLDHTWRFIFSKQNLICTESLWRLVTSEGIIVTSEDHEQLFGLPQPVNAVQQVLNKTQDKIITKFSIAPNTSDLLVSFGGNVELHFVNTSCGYESWRTFHKTFGEVICMGGGQLHIISPDKKSS